MKAEHRKLAWGGSLKNSKNFIAQIQPFIGGWMDHSLPWLYLLFGFVVRTLPSNAERGQVRTANMQQLFKAPISIRITY